MRRIISWAALALLGAAAGCQHHAGCNSCNGCNGHHDGLGLKHTAGVCDCRQVEYGCGYGAHGYPTAPAHPPAVQAQVIHETAVPVNGTVPVRTVVPSPGR